MSVDVYMYPTYMHEANKVADQPAHHTEPRFVGPDLGSNCLLILSAADKGTESKSQGQHDVQDQSHRPPAMCCCCFKSWVACGGLGA